MRIESFVIAAALLPACTHAAHQAATTPPSHAPTAVQPAPAAQASPSAVPMLDASGVQLEAGLLPPMPVAVTSFGATHDDAYLYVAGGYHGEPHNYSQEGQERTVRRLALAGDTPWETIGSLPEGAQGLELVYHAGRVCRFGGSVAQNRTDEETLMRSSKSAACLDPASGTWTDLPDLPAGRSSHGAARIGESVYVAGGWTLGEEASASTWHDSVQVLNLGDPEAGWHAVPAPLRRRAVGVAAAGSSLVVLGGLTPEGEMSQAMDVYDTASARWSRGPAFPEDAFGVALASMPDGSLVASARSGRLYKWKPGMPAWQPSGSLAFGRFFHQLVPRDANHVVAVGGISGMHTHGRTRHVEVVDLAATRAQLLAWSMDHHGSAKNRQAAFVLGDYLYLFGGNNSMEQHAFEEVNFVAEGLRIHLPSMQTQRLEDYPARRQSMVVVSDNDDVYAVGGFGFRQGGAVTESDIYAFDPEAQRWQNAGALPESRTQFGAFAQGSALWVLGGLHFDPSQQGEAAFDHRLDILHGAPDALQPVEARLPAARRAFAGAFDQGAYYLVGGMRGGFELVEDCARFTPEGAHFESLPCPGAPRLSGALVPLNDRLFLVGGSVKEGEQLATSDHVDVFDPSADQWSTLADALPFSTRHAHVLRYGDRILIVSTHNDDGRIRIALLDPAPEVGAQGDEAP